MDLAATPGVALGILPGLRRDELQGFGLAVEGLVREVLPEQVVQRLIILDQPDKLSLGQAASQSTSRR